MPEVTYRFAQEDDCTLILRFIRELADYEKMLDQVIATEDLLHAWVFERGQGKDGSLCARTAVRRGFVLFFHNFSTFLGRAGIYLEDLCYAGVSWARLWQGPLRQLARIEVERGCMWLEWWSARLEQAQHRLYLSLGAEPLKDWTVYRIAGDTLAKLAQ